MAILLGISTVAAASVIGWLSLHDVPGVERYFENGRRQCCHTTFVHDGVWATMFLLAAPVAFVARRSVIVAGGTILGLSIATFVVAGEVVHRYDVTGWGDGLEVFAYVEAAGMVFLWIIGAMIGRATRRREQARCPRG
jgi:hypothetical protein